MSEAALCKLCGQRRARRACPAVNANICTVCCGTKREVSISCPLECAYLREGHDHEKPLQVDPKAVAEPKYDLTDDFISNNEPLLLIGMAALLRAALTTEGAVDTDLLAALDALLKTHHTQESGLIYEHHAENMMAENVQRNFSKIFEELQAPVAKAEPAMLRSSNIFGMLVFLRRMGQHNLNGRPKGRMFIDILSKLVPEDMHPKKESSLIL